MMRRLPIGARILAAAFGAVLLVVGCREQPKRTATPSVPVTLAVAHRTNVPYVILANGLVTPFQTAMVASQVDGIIQRVAFREGQDVAKGQILFEVDPRPYVAAYRQALATLRRDRAIAANARNEAQRYDSLVRQDYVTREQADQQRANSEAAEATVAGDEAAVATARFNLDNTKIRAPISGRTGSLLVREGNLVHADASVALVVINQISPILVRFSVPANQLPLIQRYASAGGLPVTAIPGGIPGQSAADTMAAVNALSIDAGDEGLGGQDYSQVDTSQSRLLPGARPVQGTLFFVDNAVDTATGTVLLKASFANTNRQLWTGQFVSTLLRLFVQPNALVVPTAAVVTGQIGTYVYTVDPSGTAQQHRVTIERTAGDLAVVASGVHEGDRVVTVGQSRLTPGARVSITTTSAGSIDNGGGALRGRNGGTTRGAGRGARP
jgi:membrane fusion protein, multidrug efflux system